MYDVAQKRANHNVDVDIKARIYKIYIYVPLLFPFYMRY